MWIMMQIQEFLQNFSIAVYGNAESYLLGAQWLGRGVQSPSASILVNFVNF